ncbi:hypothetical protein ACFO0S_06255 [Chryseomicrobium palamuruense]|uniref:Lipoprotein n=1 Tax=Chryseomicrobium palamuruense TaxID=682973 RepID=A0ABV8UUE7_9BACL
MKKWSLLIVLLLSACQLETEETRQPVEPSTPVTEEQQPDTNEPSTPAEEETVVDLHDYFLPNQSSAQFEGMGNEYATFTLKTQHLYEDYVGTYEDNGGTVMQRIYRIEDERIVMILEEAEAYDADFPPLSELEALPEIETYLSLPIEEGTEFNGWTITAIDQTIDTPLQTFDHVFVLSQEGADQSVVERYFAEGFGEIKRVFRMPGGEGEEYEVTSTIASLE